MLASRPRSTVSSPPRKCSTSASSPLPDKALQHLLAAGLFEIDGQFVALDAGNGAVTELEMEDPLTHAEGRFVTAQIDRTGDEVALDGERAAALALSLLGSGALPTGGFVDAFER